MLLDAKLAFATDQALTTTADCENSPLDFEYADTELGKGKGELGVNFIIKTSCAAATSIQLDLYAGASTANVLVQSSKAFAAASGELAAGQVHFMPITYKLARYVSIKFTIVGDAGSGTVDCFLGAKQ